MTNAMRKAIKKICADYDFEDYKELKAWFKDNHGDTLDAFWFDGIAESDYFSELQKRVEMSF